MAGQDAPGNDGECVGGDQFETLRHLLPDHAGVTGAGVERAQTDTASMYRFGNMVLSRLPILSLFRHLLPQPAIPGARDMQRQRYRWPGR